MGSSDLHVHVSKFNLIQTSANNYWVGVGEGGGVISVMMLGEEIANKLPNWK